MSLSITLKRMLVRIKNMNNKFYLILANDLNYLKNYDELINKAEEISKLLFSYSKAILTSDY